ncbi:MULTISPECIES: phage portal protein [Phyllobacteriaceae]|jgi:HK97 family phage portal protein|uniref:Phage portal protein n=1 Tax=Mesorhizobium hungaricum TaxID=1566387 RepID=A0A1C2DDF9_9HYPH|nr:MULTISPECIES: phage portal protein [Mesorhizobium]MBN9235105.1 phage portal protein [Mesorhizobium sp.]OCX12695.1 phage portal protein [Mesorhizobium hungaricum]
MRGLFAALTSPRGERKDDSRYGLVDEMWADFFGGLRASKSGVSVNWKSALSVTTVLACCRVRADGLATVPWKLYQRTEKTVNGKTVAGRQEARDHPLYDLLATAPNEWMTSLEFRETQNFHVDLAGHSYTFKNWVPGLHSGPYISEMILLDPARVTHRQLNDGSLEYTLRGLDGSTQTLTRQHIWHVKGPSWDTIDGLNIVNFAREAIGLAIAAEDSHSSFHRNGVRPSGIIAADGSLDEPQLIRLAAWVRRHFGGADNTGKLLVLDKAAKFQPTQMTGVDSQHLETRKFQVERICEVLRVMPIMIGFSGDKNATFASAEQMFLAHLVHTVRPIHRRFGGSGDLFLLSKDERKKGYYTGFVDSDFLSPSLEAKAKYNQIALGGPNNPGWLTQNDVRGWDEMDAMEGADRLFAPSGMAVLDEHGKLVPIVAPSAPKSPTGA